MSSSPNLFTADPHAIWESTWQVLVEAAPPSVREILGAYNAKGEGDREMLLTLLRAKSAEDQRIASLASLHQTALQLQAAQHQPQPASVSSSSRPLSPIGSHASSPESTRSQPQNNKLPAIHISHSASTSNPAHSSSSSVASVRKRRRTASSASSSAISSPSPITPVHSDFPPSPYSSSSSASRDDPSEPSKRRKRGMAIGRLLSAEEVGHSGWGMQTSAERSTTSSEGGRSEARESSLGLRNC